MRRLFGDKHYYLALALGPLAWLGVYLIGIPVTFTELDIAKLLFPVVVYPILEETVFRGFFLSELNKRLNRAELLPNLTQANVLVSVVFAALHLLSQPPMWATLVFFPSLVFGWSMEKYQTLAAPIILHAFYNLGFIVLFL